MADFTMVTAPAFAALLLEGFKYIWRKWVIKNPEFDFPLAFYLVALPILNVAVVPLLALIGFAGFTIPTDWVGWAKGIAQVAVMSLISVFVYKNSIAELKGYNRELQA